jgi:hypothetical protein
VEWSLFSRTPRNGSAVIHNWDDWSVTMMSQS